MDMHCTYAAALFTVQCVRKKTFDHVSIERNFRIHLHKLYVGIDANVDVRIHESV